MDYWDPNTKSFNLDGKSLRIELKDIYFLMGCHVGVRWSTPNFMELGVV
jgi:hypothetical protein